MMVELGSMPVMKILSQATRIIAEGEVLQLSKVRDASTTEETYMEVIRGKTAMLFEASTHSAAALAGATAEQSEALRTFGDHLGVASPTGRRPARLQGRRGNPGQERR
jgi:octaprenyl-diphosphate synthase